MIKEPFTWWYADCEDSDRWSGQFDTYDEAVAECRDALGDGWVTTARRALFGAADLVPDADDLAEAWAENSDLAGEDGASPFDDWTPAQFASLTAHLRAAASEWMDAAGLVRQPAFMFLDMGRSLRVPPWHYAEGAEAARAGLPEDANPYDLEADEIEHLLWNDGWASAHEGVGEGDAP